MARMAQRNDEAASLFEHALADEILAEVGRQRLTARSVQDASGVKARAWSNYLTARTRHIPMTVVADICTALGIKTSEMMVRAESRAAQLDPVAIELESGLSASSRRALEKGRASVRDVADPPRRTSRRARRSA